MEITQDLAKLIWKISKEECDKVNKLTEEEQIRELLIILKCEEEWKKLAKEQRN